MGIPDQYPLPSQDDIVQLTKGKKFITIVDAAKFFYQWRVHPHDTDLQAVTIHRGQEVLLVVVIGNANSVAYVQRQMDNMLRLFREWCRAYVDDVVVVSDTFEEHLARLHTVFSTFADFNVCLDPKKAWIAFPTLTLLGKEIDSLGMTTKVDKLLAIRSLQFPRSCKQLETYLGMTGEFRHYIHLYITLHTALYQLVACHIASEAGSSYLSVYLPTSSIRFSYFYERL
ncbi:hypothetical protein PENDEC_c025G06138 [Penicillium decumbens]|uniref:Reverse transcriptase domain-containing protein n=1 Tax=Penicillium decumbens TaxID=69771 RepID=A0A1V6P0X1_PENDC|nr:hypothetical protein PENDEC_c025G06138 [Penicillium decumbens]